MVLTPDDCIAKKKKVDPDTNEVVMVPVGLDVDKVADFIIQETHMVTILPEDKMMYYNGGMYRYGGDALVDDIMGAAFGRYKDAKGKRFLNINLKKEGQSTVRERTYHEAYVQTSPTRIPFFDADLDIINVSNGLYNWRTGEFKQHTPEYPSMIQIPVEYIPGAECPTLEEIIADILKPEDVVKWYEWMAYCLYRAYPIQKAMVLFGPASTGKSQLLDMLTNMIGQDNMAPVSLQDLGGKRPDPYATAQLYGKLLSNVGDLDASAIPETGKFKMITSGADMIKARDIYSKPFSFVNFAKLIMSANELPYINDRSNGFYRRIEIIDCLNIFTAKDKVKSARLKSISDPGELSGLLNKVMTYLPDLLNRKDFSGSKTVNSVKETYTRRSNPIEQFAVDCMKEKVGSYVAKEDLYALYLKYCDELHIPYENNRSFGRQVKRIMGWTKSDEKQKSIGGAIKWCWMDIDARLVLPRS